MVSDKRAMKLKYLIFFVITIAVVLAFILFILLQPFSHHPDIVQWSKTFGGVEDEEGWFVQETGDTIMVLGNTHSFGSGDSDIWLIKLDSNGTEIWNKTFGGEAYDYGKCFQQAEDGGYIIVGGTYSYGKENCDLYIIKIEANGTEEWEKAIGGTQYDAATFVIETPDDYLVVVGNTYSFGSGDSDIWLIKLDSNGTEIWSKFFGGAKYDDARCVRATLDGGYIIAGETESYENSSLDIWIIKTDSNGTELWNKTFGGVNDDVCNDIRQISNDKYIIAGHTQSFSNSWDAWIICIDSNGTEIWNKTFGGKADDGASSITQTSDSGYIIVGYTNTYSKDEGDLWIIKTDSNGTELWNKTFGGNKDDSGVWVQRTKDGNYIIAGYTNSYGKGKSDIWIMKIKDI
jgi:hypothetical protein